MSTLQISHSSLQNLTHESAEIRLRTLEQVASRLERALMHKEELNFKPGELCKQLIRWFGCQPVIAPLEVLDLLRRLLSAPSYGERAVKRLGVERFRHEMQKVQQLLRGRDEELRSIREIQQILANYDRKQSKLPRKERLEETPNNLDLLSIGAGSSDKIFSGSVVDCEVPWSQPTAADYASMKFLADILLNPFASREELDSSLQHLQLTMADYPAEYLLQAPHIYRNLLQLYGRQKQDLHCSIFCVTATLLAFVRHLERGLKMRRKSAAYSRIQPAICSSAAINMPAAAAVQLRIEKALSMLLSTSLDHLESQSYEDNTVIWEILYAVFKLRQEQSVEIDTSCLRRMAGLVVKLGAKLAELKHCTRMRLEQLLLLFLLQDAVAPSIDKKVLKELEVFGPMLRDYVLREQFPKRHRCLRTLLTETDVKLGTKFQLLGLYEAAFKLAAKVLSTSTDPDSAELIGQSEEICKVLDKLQSRRLVAKLFQAVVDCSARYCSGPELRAKACNLLLCLLRLPHMSLKSFAYKQLAGAFKRHIGCLMNGEPYSGGCSNSALLKAQIVGVPLSGELLLQLVTESSESDDDEIKGNSVDILSLLLQSEQLLGESWVSFVPLLLPSLPLLLCCEESSKIRRPLLKLYDPDARQLPYVSVLQGNAGLLFHADAQQRSEGLARLVYTLNSLKGAEDYLPNLLEISDTLPNDICLLAAPREYRRIFSEIASASCSADTSTTLNNLFQLLEAPDIEPLIRKTTLMQLNALCASWRATAELCHAGAYYLVLRALESSLQKTMSADYPDAAIPAVSILVKVLFYDEAVRRELAETPNIYVLVLRALMLYAHDIQMRQDASVCLFQLLYANYLVATEQGISVPTTLRNLQLPVRCEFRSINSCDERESLQLTMLFESAEEETRYWRLVVAAASCGDFEHISEKHLSAQEELDISEGLKLTEQDVRLIRATQPAKNLRRILGAAGNATDHQTLIQAAIMLKQQLLLLRLPDVCPVSTELATELYSVVSKYLQLSPGNPSDVELYEHLLDVTSLSVRLPLTAVISGLVHALQSDSQHALLLLLTENAEIPLRLFHKICSLLLQLLENYPSVSSTSTSTSNGTERSSFFGDLFDVMFERAFKLFEVRDLQRVRCLLTLLRALSVHHLNMTDKLLSYYCRRLLQLSLALKSFTQTGSQWHRDCLLTICQLYTQMQETERKFRISAGGLKYLSGLCGHSDAKVRALAWCTLHCVASTRRSESKGPHSEGNEETEVHDSGVELLLSELGYLPGGFVACCLSTFLDRDEVVCVRQMAGELFAIIVRKGCEAQHVQQLVDQHRFFDAAHEALQSSLVLSESLPLPLDTSSIVVTTCELIGCYARISLELARQTPQSISELCGRAFLGKLYEVLKQPVASPDCPAYLEMCADICQLYAACYGQNLGFLQRTLCRDSVWLTSFCKLVLQDACTEGVLVDLIQLLVILCKDNMAFNQICTNFTLHAAWLVKVFERAFAVTRLNSPLQRCSLSALSLMLIKSQPELGTDLEHSFLEILETQIADTEAGKPHPEAESDKENQDGNRKKTDTKVIPRKCSEEGKTAGPPSGSVAEHLCIMLVRLFVYLYPVESCKFTAPPNRSQQQVSETLALLLKVSPQAQRAAHNLRLHDKLLRILKHFFNEFSVTSCTTYVRRYGEAKKMAVVNNMLLLLNLLLHWHSARTVTVTDDLIAGELSKVLMQLWPWLSHSADLKHVTLLLCACLSERSLVVCQKFVVMNTSSSSAKSIVQSVVQIVNTETTKVKSASSDCQRLIVSGLRILMNCCACTEGRSALLKTRILDIFDSLYPFNLKAARLKPEVLQAWLQFWELFSRYDEGANIRHLNSLCAVINRSAPRSATRLMSLTILRNMCFLGSNRSSLMASTDFIYTMNEIVSQPMEHVPGTSYEEQVLMCVAIWKLISGGVKFVAIIRGTKLAKQLHILYDSLKILKEEDPNLLKQLECALDLMHVLETILKFFQN